MSQWFWTYLRVWFRHKHAQTPFTTKNGNSSWLLTTSDVWIVCVLSESVRHNISHHLHRSRRYYCQPLIGEKLDQFVSPQDVLICTDPRCDLSIFQQLYREENNRSLSAFSYNTFQYFVQSQRFYLSTGPQISTSGWVSGVGCPMSMAVFEENGWCSFTYNRQ